MNKEFEFLKIINNTLKSKYLGNDCAYLDEYKLSISSDSLIEDVHFKLDYMTPYEIAKKAVLVNISDILASGSEPKYITINLSGKLDEDFIKEFYLGIKEITKKYNIEVIGGDLTKSDKIMISITAFGSYLNRMISDRKSAKPDYIIAVSGEFGSSRKGLEELIKGKKESYFIDYHKEPKLNPKVSYSIALNAKNPYAMMDSSDGLYDCLYQISNMSKVKLNVEYDKIPKKTPEKDFVLFGGEDYSLVVCLDKKDFKETAGLTKIGYVEKGLGVYIDNKQIEYKGYKHFD